MEMRCISFIKLITTWMCRYNDWGIQKQPAWTESKHRSCICNNNPESQSVSTTRFSHSTTTSSSLHVSPFLVTLHFAFPFPQNTYIYLKICTCQN